MQAVFWVHCVVVGWRLCLFLLLRSCSNFAANRLDVFLNAIRNVRYVRYITPAITAFQPRKNARDIAVIATGTSRVGLLY